MTTVAQIAAKAIGAAQKAIPDAVHAATLTRTVQGAYNATTGAYATTPGPGFPQTGRAVVDSERPVGDVFAEYVVGAGDELILLEGFTSCAENDTLTFAGRTRIVRKVQDILAAGSLFFCVAR